MIIGYILIFIKFFENNIILCSFCPSNIETGYLFKNINFFRSSHYCISLIVILATVNIFTFYGLFFTKILNYRVHIFLKNRCRFFYFTIACI